MYLIINMINLIIKIYVVGGSYKGYRVNMPMYSVIRLIFSHYHMMKPVTI